MRVWDVVSPVHMCRQHLLAQHNEIHVLFKTVTGQSNGWRNHPEAKRWTADKLRAAHDWTVSAMKQRGYKHKTPLPDGAYDHDWPAPWQPIDEQIKVLRDKQCQCKVFEFCKRCLGYHPRELIGDCLPSMTGRGGWRLA